ncbi:VOC family protein [Bacillus sp. BGMRC 2118]|nr:VOC family protein [Bacillus sp. BGMRC 2118]
MEILKIKLCTLNIKEMKAFYTEVLEMELIEVSEKHFTVRAGNSKIEFHLSETLPSYHFAVRTNIAYLTYIFNKVSKTHKDKVLCDIQGFESGYWKGKQVYFHDPDGNIVEIIEQQVRCDEWYDVCEIGMPAGDVEQLAMELKELPNKNKPESESFQFFGDETGNFVLVKESRGWFPTKQPSTIHPIDIEIRAERVKNTTITSRNLPYTINVLK